MTEPDDGSLGEQTTQRLEAYLKESRDEALEEYHESDSDSWEWYSRGRYSALVDALAWIKGLENNEQR